ncbi:MAG: hypothetical protein AB7G06_09460 [Bdellovibrionales bacterium]
MIPAHIQNIVSALVPKTHPQIAFVRNLEDVLASLPGTMTPVYLKNGLIATNTGFFAFLHAPDAKDPAKDDYVLVHGEDEQALETDASGHLRDMSRVNFITGFRRDDLRRFKDAHFKTIMTMIAEKALHHFTAIRHADQPDTQYGPSATYHRVPHMDANGIEVPGLYDILKWADNLLTPDLVTQLDHTFRNVFNAPVVIARGLTLEQTEKAFEQEHALDCQDIMLGNNILARHFPDKNWRYRQHVMRHALQGTVHRGKSVAGGVANNIYENVSKGRWLAKTGMIVAGSLFGAAKVTLMAIGGAAVSALDVPNTAVDVYLDKQIIEFRKNRVREFADLIKHPSPFGALFLQARKDIQPLRMVPADELFTELAPNLKPGDQPVARNLFADGRVINPTALDCTMDAQVAHIGNGNCLALHRCTGVRMVVRPETRTDAGRVLMYYNAAGNLDESPDPPVRMNRVLNAGRIADISFSQKHGMRVDYCQPAGAQAFVRNAMGIAYAEKEFNASDMPTDCKPRLPRRRPPPRRTMRTPWSWNGADA